jgi:hypothetical protein
MKVGQFFKEVVCAPYSIPIGLINYKVQTLGMCSKVRSEKLEANMNDSHDNLYRDRSDIESQDIISSSQVAVLNQGIQDILAQTFNMDTVTVSTESIANVSAWTLNDDGEVVTILPLSQDPNNEYTEFIYNYTTEKLGDDGKVYLINEFGCTPTVEQSQTIKTYSIDIISNESFENILAEIIASVENTTTETGSATPSTTYTSVLTDNRIKNMLKQKIDTMMTNISRQTVSASLKLDYIDRYGKCVYDYTDKGLLKSNSSTNFCLIRDPMNNEYPEYIYGVCKGSSNVLKQTVNIEIISKNIIDISIGMILENKNEVTATNEVTINRVTNHRVIVVSLLFNVIVLYLLYKIFSAFINRIN